MRRFQVFFIGFIICLPSFGADKKIQTPKSVLTFIKNVEKMSYLTLADKSEINDLFWINIELFSGPTPGIPIDVVRDSISEFSFLGLPKVDYSNSYCDALRNYICLERILKLTHEIETTTPLSLPDGKGKSDLIAYKTMVKKDCNVKGSSKILWQEMVTDIKTGLISDLATYEKKPTIGEELKKQEAIKNNADNKFSETDYLNLASRYYSIRDFNKTYNTLKELTEVYGSYAEGWYRLASLIYDNPDKFNRISSNPKATAKGYLEKAVNIAKGDLKKKLYKIYLSWSYPSD